MSEWRSLQTLPEQGEVVLMFRPRVAQPIRLGKLLPNRTGYWFDLVSHVPVDEKDITLWMPIPTPK